MTDLDNDGFFGQLRSGPPPSKPHKKTVEPEHAYAVSNMCYTIAVVVIAVALLCFGKYIRRFSTAVEPQTSTSSSP